MPWEISGNGGTSAAQHFLGTTDAQAFSIRVNNKRALRIEPQETPNWIAGHDSNIVAPGVIGATIAGGGADGSLNSVDAHFGSISGGRGNRVSGERATVPGGEGNSAIGAFSFAAGRRAKANHLGSFVWADAADQDFASTADNQFLIKAAGGVGIGTATPQAALDVAGNVRVMTLNASGNIATDALNASGNIAAATLNVTGNIAAAALNASGTMSAGSFTVGPWPANPDNYMFVGVDTLDQSQAANYALLQGVKDGAIGITFLNSPVSLRFRIGNADKMRIDASNNIHIAEAVDLNFGTQVRQMLNLYGATYGIGVQGNTFYFRTNNDYSWFYKGKHHDAANNPGSGGKVLMRLNDTGNLTITGAKATKASGTTWSVSSDIRLKENVRPLECALDKLLQLRGVTFEWKDPTKHANATGAQMGMIADEVEKVFPKWISRDSDGFKLLTLDGFEALVVEALRTLQREIEQLRGRFALAGNLADELPF